MRILAEIDPQKWERVQELLRQGRYESAAQFIGVALENQLLLETRQSVESLSASFQSRGSQTDLPSRESSTEMPMGRLKQLDRDIAPAETRVWALYNRIFPVKVTVRVLSSMLEKEQDESVELRSLKEEAAIWAKSVGRQLASSDKQGKKSRMERLATGLPIRRADKSSERFKDMFVGSLSKKGEGYGFPVLLKFITLDREDNGVVRAHLTPPGYEFAMLRSPVLDNRDSKPEATLSAEESQFYLGHIKEYLPREWELSRRIMKAISDGDKTPSSIDKLLLAVDPTLKDTEVGPERAGIISRLSELGCVRRIQNGLHVEYELASGAIQISEE